MTSFTQLIMMAWFNISLPLVIYFGNRLETFENEVIQSSNFIRLDN